ncbi:MAG: O-antigen ligase family protein [Bacteroidales bacterium]|nr:O-antigen ligase family protein [Bacteroidales bacterium]
MTPKKAIRFTLTQAYVLGLMMVAAGLTLSPFLMGMSQFWLVAVFIVDCFSTKSINKKLLRFWNNKPAVLLVAFYLMHVVGLLYTTDFEYAMKDLRVKLPILVMPFILSSIPPLGHKRFNQVMLVYVLSVFIATIFSSVSYWRHDYEDVREISHFISHIRFCLNIVFCIAIIFWYIATTEAPGSTFSTRFAINLYLQYFLAFWFVYQIYIFESLSGYVVLAAVVVLSLLYAFLRWKRGRGWRIGIGIGAGVLLVVGIIFTVHWLKPFVELRPVDFNTLEKKTALGNDYWHDTICNPVEDGQYVGLYYCRKELQEAWTQRSELPFEGKTLNDEDLEATLARYLTSKGLRKDAEGVMALTDEDIRNIEQGVANYNNWKHPGVRARLSSTLFEYNLYRRFNNPNGGSLSQRIEYTRAAFHLIRQHPWFGVGTGDVPQAFRQTYDEIHSPLKEEFRFRAHNQYLSIALAFGLVGLAFFLVVLLYSYFSSKQRRTYLYTVFLCIMLLSMFPEDTLETQAGASLFAFFEALLLVMKED